MEYETTSTSQNSIEYDKLETVSSSQPPSHTSRKKWVKNDKQARVEILAEFFSGIRMLTAVKITQRSCH